MAIAFQAQCGWVEQPRYVCSTCGNVGKASVECVRGIRVPATLIGCGTTLLLVACGTPTGVSIPAGGDDLAQCEVQQLRVEDLAATGEPGCNLEGSSLIFPDGTTLVIEPVGTNVGLQPDHTQAIEFHALNWGVPGVGAALVKDGTVAAVWASSPRAMDLQYEQLRIEGLA